MILPWRVVRLNSDFLDAVGSRLVVPIFLDTAQSVLSVILAIHIFPAVACVHLNVVFVEGRVFGAFRHP